QEDYRVRCTRCVQRKNEEVYYQEKKSFYNSLKYTAHSGSCERAYKHGQDTDQIDDAYDLYVKGTGLKPSGDVVLGKIVYGNTGIDFTKHHPEWRATNRREKDPYYDQRTALWQKVFSDIDVEEEKVVDAMDLYEEKHSEPTKEVYNVEVPYVLHQHQKRTATCEIQEDKCIIDGEEIEWEEIKKMQTRFTRLPGQHERKFHYKGPGTQCWDRSTLNEPEDHCAHCVWMLQTCRVIANLPEE